MRYREFTAYGRRVVVAVLDKEDEPVGELTGLVRTLELRGAQLSAVGGFRTATLGYFDRDRRDYLPIEVSEQCEVLSLLGDVAVADDQPVIHAHAVLGHRDGRTVGGHLMSGEVWPTLEVVLTEVAPHLAKRVDLETGLALIDLSGDEGPAPRT